MLAPSVERTHGPAQALAEAARDAWNRLEERLRTSGAHGRGSTDGHPFQLHRDGILHLAPDADRAMSLQTMMRDGDVWLGPTAVRERFPLLAPVHGAVLHTRDGFVDVPGALTALTNAVKSHPQVRVIDDALDSIIPVGMPMRVSCASGQTFAATTLVLAAGAWSGQIGGLPRALPVRPLRGSLISYPERLTDLPVYGGDGHTYLLPRGRSTVVGATSVESGFDVSTAASDVARLAAAGASIIPRIGMLSPMPAWSGLRPMTPDGLAIIGREPEAPALIYACGHGRNGFLQAAITAEVVSALARGLDPPWNITPFRPDRFG
jgi:glycine oxidase